MDATSHRPWETNPSPTIPQTTQTLPSIASLTAKLPQQPHERGPTDLSIIPPQRDSGGWMPSNTCEYHSFRSIALWRLTPRRPCSAQIFDTLVELDALS